MSRQVDTLTVPRIVKSKLPNVPTGRRVAALTVSMNLQVDRSTGRQVDGSLR